MICRKSFYIPLVQADPFQLAEMKTTKVVSFSRSEG
jgi:hypothetical protein